MAETTLVRPIAGDLITADFMDDLIGRIEDLENGAGTPNGSSALIDELRKEIAALEKRVTDLENELSDKVSNDDSIWERVLTVDGIEKWLMDRPRSWWDAILEQWFEDKPPQWWGDQIQPWIDDRPPQWWGERVLPWIDDRPPQWWGERVLPWIDNRPEQWWNERLAPWIQYAGLATIAQVQEYIDAAQYVNEPGVREMIAGGNFATAEDIEMRINVLMEEGIIPTGVTVQDSMAALQKEVTNDIVLLAVLNETGRTINDAYSLNAGARREIVNVALNLSEKFVDLRRGL